MDYAAWKNRTVDLSGIPITMRIVINGMHYVLYGNKNVTEEMLELGHRYYNQELNLKELFQYVKLTKCSYQVNHYTNKEWQYSNCLDNNWGKNVRYQQDT